MSPYYRLRRLVKATANYHIVHSYVNVSLFPKHIILTGLYQMDIWRRIQSVQIWSAFSREPNLLFGDSQGSVLGPALFIFYTTPLGKIMQRLWIISSPIYWYMSFKPYDVASRYGAVFHIWMKDHFLKLNDGKTYYFYNRWITEHIYMYIYWSRSVINQSFQMMIH